MTKPARNQIANEVQARLQAGDRKETVYRELKDLYGAGPVQRPLAQWPDPADKEKNKSFNYTLLILAAFFAGLKLVQIVQIFQTVERAAILPVLPLLAIPIIIYTFVIYGIKNGNLIGYMLIVLLGLQNILQVAQTSPLNPHAFMLLAMSLAAVILGGLQKKRLFPNVTVLMRHKKDADGNPIF